MGQFNPITGFKLDQFNPITGFKLDQFNPITGFKLGQVYPITGFKLGQVYPIFGGIMSFFRSKIGFGSIFPVWEIPIKYQSKPINSPFFFPIWELQKVPCDGRSSSGYTSIGVQYRTMKLTHRQQYMLMLMNLIALTGKLVLKKVVIPLTYVTISQASWTMNLLLCLHKCGGKCGSDVIHGSTCGIMSQCKAGPCSP